MNSKTLLALCLTLVLFAFSPAFAQGNIDIEPNDSMQSVLLRQVGQTVELRMASGEKIGGKLEKVNEKLAFLSQVTGAEYFSAVVVIDDVAAVLVRAKK
ncbi:MAG TPA: hypothetical protein VF683_04830 [Chthoniobacterales bacterium]